MALTTSGRLVELREAADTVLDDDPYHLKESAMYLLQATMHTMYTILVHTNAHVV